MKTFFLKCKEQIKYALNEIKEHCPKFSTPAFITKITGSVAYQKFLFTLNRYSLLFHIPMSMGFVFLLEWLSRHSFLLAVDFVVHHFPAFLYNSYIVYIIFLLVFLFKRRAPVRLFIALILVLLGVINCVILLNRVTPFGFTDLYMIGDLLTMKASQYFSRQQANITLVCVVIYMIFLVFLFFKTKKHTSRFKLWIRGIFVAACIFSFPLVTSFLQSQNVLASYFGNLAQGYRDYGYLYGFTTSVIGRGMDKPFGYNENNVISILDQTSMGESGTDGAEGPNVIVILLESFYDVSEVDFIETNVDPIPYFHSLEDNFSSGYCTVPVVGAGTCNTEFEVLTGMSCQFFGPGEYPQKTILKERECESYAHTMNSLGYGTHVVHNNGGNFYSRRNAFSMMGFDTFTAKEDLDITKYTPLRTWATDDILIEATRDALDSTPESDYVYTITVQTHGSYPKTQVIEHPSIEVTCNGKDEELQNQWDYYIQMLHEEDNFIRSYISMLAQREEDTLVIMFGDHLPTMGLNADEVATGDLFLTKYATWNNFGMDVEDMDLTSYQLVAEYLDRLDIHGGTILDYNQYQTHMGARPGSFAYMNGLETLQYDLLYGNRYAYRQETPNLASDIQMGIKNVRIHKVYAYGGRLHIFGENFTPWTYAFVDGERVPTTYESGERLSIHLSSIPNGSPLFVAHTGSNDTIFRKSNIVHYIDKFEGNEENELLPFEEEEE